MTRRLTNALLGGIFVVAAFAEEMAERVATWADELLIKRAQSARVTPGPRRSHPPRGDS